LIATAPPGPYNRLAAETNLWGPLVPGEVTFAINVVVAALLGVAIGLERQFRQHPAGMRTNGLVCLGAALFVSLSRMIDHESSPTRVAAQVVSGLGFLGGGVILREGLNVRGLTTAATLWCSGAVGTLAGAGQLLPAAIGTAAILVLNLVLRPLVQRIDAYMRTAVAVETLYRVKVVCGRQQEALIRSIFMRHINSQPNMLLQGIATQEMVAADQSAVVAEVCSAQRNDRYMEDVVRRMSIEPTVTAVSWERVR
jgi:putative Mg2+ transporter-C (MgtC) family protein